MVDACAQAAIHRRCIAPAAKPRPCRWARRRVAALVGALPAESAPHPKARNMAIDVAPERVLISAVERCERAEGRADAGNSGRQRGVIDLALERSSRRR
jgi:hypothetical protein